MEKQISQTQVAYDKAFDTFKSFVSNYGIAHRDEFAYASITFDKKQGVTNFTIEHWALNGFPLTHVSSTDDGRTIIQVHLHRRAEKELPQYRITCKTCYNEETIRADVAEMFGINVDPYTKNEVETCAVCTSGHKCLKRS
jgi:hypothetical protein